MRYVLPVSLTVGHCEIHGLTSGPDCSGPIVRPDWATVRTVDRLYGPTLRPLLSVGLTVGFVGRLQEITVRLVLLVGMSMVHCQTRWLPLQAICEVSTTVCPAPCVVTY